MKRVLVCADIDLNLIDGSSIWAQNTTLAFAATGLCRIDYLAKATPRSDILFGALRQSPAISILDGPAHWASGDPSAATPPRLSPVQMASLAKKLNKRAPYDVVILRGRAVVRAVASCPDLLSKCWLYITDIPQSTEVLNNEDVIELRTFALACNKILCQSAGFATLWKRAVPGIPEDKILLYPPIVADTKTVLSHIRDRKKRAVYAGKFSPNWMTLELVQSWPRIAHQVRDASLEIAGDKIHNPPEAPDFKGAMQTALTGTPGVTWHGAMTRDAVGSLLQTARVGFSWRSSTLDNTIEYSTKMLEYGAAGCAVILNRNSLHEELCGDDYPLFANSPKELINASIKGLQDSDVAQFAAERMMRLAAKHAFSNRVEQIRGWLTIANRTPTKAAVHILSNQPKTLLFAGHDFKFAYTLMKALASETGMRILVDEWQGHAKHEERKSRELLKQADVIFCEWCLGNLEWYSWRKESDQRLIARCHAQERNLPYLRRANLKNVEHVSFVNEIIRQEVVATHALDTNRTSVISLLFPENKFTLGMRAKEADRTLGMIGITPRLKRLDRAIDLLETLLKTDHRYALRVKGPSPFSYKWVHDREEEVHFFKEQMRRINGTEGLRYRVVFDPPGDDINEWLRLVGFILSPSDTESFHAAAGEGMMTGAVPLIWRRAGADAIYPSEYIFNTTQDVVTFVLNNSARLANPEHRQGLREWFISRHPSDAVIRRWRRIIEGTDGRAG